MAITQVKGMYHNMPVIFHQEDGKTVKITPGSFAPDAKRHAIALSMKDLSNVTPAVAAILSPARNRLMPLCLLRAFRRRGPEKLHAQGLHGV